MDKYNEQMFGNLHQWMKDNREEKYREFNEGLTPGSEGTSYGIRVPVLREKAKEILKDEWKGFLKYAKQDDTYEVIVLHGMVVSLAKIPFDEKILLFEEYIPRITNWAFCDIVCGDFKDIRKNRECGWKFIKKYIGSEKEFEVRTAVVLLLQHYLTDEYIERVLKELICVKHPGYYAKMAVAWAVSTAYVKFPKETYPILEENMLDAETHNKAVQKIRDSYRVSKADKERLVKR